MIKKQHKEVQKFLKAALNPKALARAFSYKTLCAYAHCLLTAMLIQTQTTDQNKKDEKCHI